MHCFIMRNSTSQSKRAFLPFEVRSWRATISARSGPAFAFDCRGDVFSIILKKGNLQEVLGIDIPDLYNLGYVMEEARKGYRFRDLDTGQFVSAELIFDEIYFED